MKLYILSDLHLEFEDFVPPSLDVDVVVLAGDIGVGVDGIRWAQYTFPDKPVLYVMGNHEHYEHNLQINIKNIETESGDSNIHVLEKREVNINGVQFLGCTLWTDFNLTGNTRSSKYMATRYINDYECIHYSEKNRTLTTRDTSAMHARSLTWLKKQTRKAADKRVIITHHAPSAHSLPDEFVNQKFQSAYASSLDDFVIQSNANLWVHGHIHAACDYNIGDTRVVCNPRGYHDRQSKGFSASRIIEI